MAAFTKANNFVFALGQGLHNLSANASLRAVLALTSISAGVSVYASVTEITAGNGYATGGLVFTGTTWSTAAGTARLKAADLVWTASGGSIANFQYVLVVDDKATADNIIGFWDYGAPVTITNGNTFTLDLNATNGIVSLT